MWLDKRFICFSLTTTIKKTILSGSLESDLVKSMWKSNRKQSSNPIKESPAGRENFQMQTNEHSIYCWFCNILYTYMHSRMHTWCLTRKPTSQSVSLLCIFIVHFDSFYHLIEASVDSEFRFGRVYECLQIVFIPSRNASA